mmetsp:Transcript_41511/g.120112  ORF Transcript_41511/g.120112 Transcript_41511/m.120112 type:complete len:559 (+) Transcript_41511:438-2114(+)
MLGLKRWIGEQLAEMPPATDQRPRLALQPSKHEVGHVRDVGSEAEAARELPPEDPAATARGAHRVLGAEEAVDGLVLVSHEQPCTALRHHNVCNGRVTILGLIKHHHVVLQLRLRQGIQLKVATVRHPDLLVAHVLHPGPELANSLAKGILWQQALAKEPWQWRWEVLRSHIHGSRVEKTLQGGKACLCCLEPPCRILTAPPTQAPEERSEGSGGYDVLCAQVVLQLVAILEAARGKGQLVGVPAVHVCGEGALGLFPYADIEADVEELEVRPQRRIHPERGGLPSASKGRYHQDLRGAHVTRHDANLLIREPEARHVEAAQRQLEAGVFEQAVADQQVGQQAPGADILGPSPSPAVAAGKKLRGQDGHELAELVELQAPAAHGRAQQCLPHAARRREDQRGQRCPAVGPPETKALEHQGTCPLAGGLTSEGREGVGHLQHLLQGQTAPLPGRHCMQRHGGAAVGGLRRSGKGWRPAMAAHEALQRDAVPAVREDVGGGEAPVLVRGAYHRCYRDAQVPGHPRQHAGASNGGTEEDGALLASGFTGRWRSPTAEIHEE